MRLMVLAFAACAAYHAVVVDRESASRSIRQDLAVLIGRGAVDTSFDPYLEGPQGGIWFWSVFGVLVMRLRPQSPHR